MDSEPILALKKVKDELDRMRVALAGGGNTVVAFPKNVRQKWQRIDATLDQLDWTTIEALDEAGNVLALIRCETIEEPEAVEEIEIVEGSPLGQLVRAQEMALRHHTEMAQRVFDSQNRVIEMLTGQLETQNENYLDAVGHAHQYALQAAEAQATIAPQTPEDTGDPVVKAAVEMAIKTGMTKMLSPAPKTAKAAK